MTIPTDDLRARLARELDELGPGPDLVGAAVARGAGVVRRRRVAAGAALAVAAVGGGATLTAVLQPDDDTPRKDEDQVASDTTPSTPAWDPLADGKVTEDEWRRAVSEALTASLPDRYGTVAPIRSDFDIQMFGTEAGTPPLQADVIVSGWHRSEHPVRYRDHTCAAIEAARELYSCSEVEFGDGWLAVVTTDLLPQDNAGSFEEGERVEIPPYDPDNVPEDWAFATAVQLVNQDVYVELGVAELGWDGIAGNDRAGITDDELLAVVQTPEFLDLVEVGVQWWYDAPESAPIEWNGQVVKPLTGKGQQVPPAYPS